MSSDEPDDSTDTTFSDRLTSYYGESLGKTFGIRAAAFLVFLGVAYVWRPLLHDPLYSMRYSPSGLIVGTLTILTLVVLWFSPRIQALNPDNTSPHRTHSTNSTESGVLGAVKSIGFKFSAFLGVWLLAGITYGLAAGIVTLIGWFSIAVTIVVGPIYVRMTGGLDVSRKTVTVASIIILVFMLSVTWVYAAGLIQQREMAQSTMNNANNVTEFPEVNEENARIVPRAVDKNQVKGSVSYRKHRLGESDVARSPNGSMMWSYAVEPEGTRNKIIENQRGVALSDMTGMSNRELRLEDDTGFPIGEGMFVHRSSEWNLKKTGYWSQYNDDSVRFVHGGEAYMSYPKTGHEWRVEMVGGVIPIPYTVPVSDGVAVIDTDGNIDHMTLEDAQNDPVLDGQRLYPLDVTNRYMHSLNYRNGIINQMGVIGSHQNEVEVADLPAGAGNKQPFTIDMERERFSYVVAFEPYGEDTRGLDEVWFVDAETGEYTYYETGEDNTLFGPERAMGIVRSEDSQTGWGDDFEVVEPVPTVVKNEDGDNELWWHAKVVPTDNLDITRNVFVNAHTGEAVELHTEDAVEEFIAGEDPSNINETVDDVEQEPADDEPDVAYYLVIKNSDGEVIDRIPVAPDEEVSIVPANNSTTTNATAGS